jgi:hypothetical protein
MPFGQNGIMLERLKTLLAGQSLADPDKLFGKPRTILIPGKKEGSKPTVKVTLSEPRGILEHLMFEEAPFHRPCMYCTDPEDKGQVGFAKLVQKIEPSTGAKVKMVIIVDLLSLPFWALVAFTSIFELERYLPESKKNKRRKNLSDTLDGFPPDDFDDQYPLSHYTNRF